MVLALLVFLIVVGIVFGGYTAVTRMPEIMARRQLDRRLSEVSSTDEPSQISGSSVVRRTSEGPLPALDRMVEGTRVGFGLKRLIEQSGIKTTPSAIMALCGVLAAVFSMAAIVFTHQLLLVPLAAVAGGIAPIAFLRNRRSARLRKFEEMFPEALDVMSRAIRAGHAFQTALGMAADELAEPVGPELKKTFDQQNFGLPLRDALNELSERVNILDVRFFVTAVLIQRDTGGNLSEILDNLAHVVRERFKIMRQVRVHTAHGRFTGYVLLALPAFLAVALSFLNPDHMALLFREHMGRVMIVAAIVMQSVGFVWIRKVIKIEV